MRGMVYRLARRMLILLGALNLVFQIFYWLPPNIARMDHNRDLWIYYDATQKAAAGLSMYHRASRTYGPTEFPTWYVNPPQLASVLYVFHGHPHLLNDVWYPLMVISFWAMAWGLATLSTGSSVGQVRGTRLASTLAWGGVLGLSPYFYYTMSVGNVEPVLWSAFALAVGSSRPNLLLAVMFSTKPYAMWPLIAYSEKHRKTIAVSIMVIFAGIFFAACVVGLGQFRDWVTLVGPSAGQGTFSSINLSLSMAVLRILRMAAVWHYTAGPLPQGPKLFLSAAGILGPALIYAMTRRLDLKWRMIWTYVAGMLFSPLCWGIYLTNLWTAGALLMGNVKPFLVDKFESQA